MSNEIKVGDKVRVREDAPKIFLLGWYGFIGNVVDIEDSYTKIECNDCTLVIPTKYLVKVDAEKKPNVGSIKIPVEVDLTDSYWDAYTADLAKEVALKVANKYTEPKETAEYAVKVAQAVVEGLKRK